MKLARNGPLFWFRRKRGAFPDMARLLVSNLQKCRVRVQHISTVVIKLLGCLPFTLFKFWVSLGSSTSLYLCNENRHVPTPGFCIEEMLRCCPSPDVACFVAMYWCVFVLTQFVEKIGMVYFNVRLRPASMLDNIMGMLGGGTPK